MDTILELLKFQIEKLDYQFRDVDLLIKALTHSADNYENIYNFPFKSKTHQRLRVVGEAVLKLVASEYVIRSSKSLRDDQGSWTVHKSDLLQEDKQTKVGQNLFLNATDNNTLNSFQFIRIHSSNLNNPSFKIRYADFVKAIFGAVFLDSKEDTGIKNCFNLFVKLWSEFLENEQIDNLLEDLFPTPEPVVLKYWTEYGKYNLSFVFSLCQAIGVLASPTLLWESIIHKSFYDPIKNEPAVFNCRLPDYERLEFLGDAVLDVILVQIFWISYPDYDFTQISVNARKLAESGKQKEIYKQLNLEQFVLKRSVQNWENYGDIVESIIGALYVGNGFVLSKKFIVNKWKLPYDERLSDLEMRLNYRFTNSDVFIQSLTHESFYTNPEERANSKQKLMRYKYLGKAVINLLAIEYAFKIGKISARAGAIEAKKNFLCSRDSLKQISDNLQLIRHVKIHEALKTSKTPYDSYEDFLLSILGAVCSELTLGENLDKLKEMFYRLWNPLLKNTPERSLITCFIPEPIVGFEIFLIELGHSGENDNDFKLKVENLLNYKFRNFVLFQQAITPRSIRSHTINQTFGDMDRFALIGTYAVKYYTIVQTHVALPTVTSFNALETFLNNFAEDTINDAKLSFPCKMMHAYWSIVNQTPQGIPYRDTLLATAALGAIYVDMEASTANLLTDRWTRYLEMLQKRAAVTREQALKEKANMETRTKTPTKQVSPETRRATTIKTSCSPIRLQAQPESAPKLQSTVLPLSYKAETQINTSKTKKYTVPARNIKDSKDSEDETEILTELEVCMKKHFLQWNGLIKMKLEKERRSKATQTEDVQKFRFNYYTPESSTKFSAPVRNAASQSTFAESSKSTHTENVYFSGPYAQNSFPSAENKNLHEVKYARRFVEPEMHYSENRNVNYRSSTSSSRTLPSDSSLPGKTGFYSGYYHNSSEKENIIIESAKSENRNNTRTYDNIPTASRRDTAENLSNQNVPDTITFSEYVGVFIVSGILYAIWQLFGQ